jgi:hypothetical protein
MSSACATSSFAPAHGSPVRRSALARWGVRLALLAVLGSLLAPLARLSAEVATGKLGGLCLASAVYGLSTDGATPGTPDGAAAVGLDTCQGCASSLMTPPPVATTAEPPALRLVVATAFAERLAERPAFERPPGRAPPALV